MTNAVTRFNDFQLAFAPVTLRKFAAEILNYSAWCARNGFEAMPALPETVGAYLADTGEGYALSTLQRRVAAIAWACRGQGYQLDGRHPVIRETLRGIARTRGDQSRRAAALTPTEIGKLCRACGTDLRGLRDRALFLVGFAAALRRSELVALDVAHLTRTPGGLKLSIKPSNTDKGEGVVLARRRAEDACPVAALETWLARAGIISGPVFRKVNYFGRIGDRRLNASAVNHILCTRAADAGLKGTLAEPISPRGFRAGFVTTAYRNGIPDEEIMAHTRHTRLTAMRKCVRRQQLGRSSPSGKHGR